jgi:SAM-dependent methyltransferase
MGYVELWRQQVRAARAAQGDQPRPGAAWDERRAAWFNRFAGQSDRSHTYRFIAPHVHGQVLEVGPGPGAYTRLLLQQAGHVVALEPSPSMVRALRDNLGDAQALEIIQSSIEDYLAALVDYDLVLAANVLGGIERIDDVLLALWRHSSMLAVVIGSSAAAPEWSRAVQRQLLGRAAPDPALPGGAELLAVLRELALPCEVHTVRVPVHTFAGPVDLFDWAEGLSSLTPDERPTLERVLGPFISEEGGLFGLPTDQETLVVLVRGQDGAPPPELSPTPRVAP